MAKPTCTVKNCDKPIRVKSRGLCATHYDRWITTGRLELLPRPTPAERFWAKVNRGGPDDCWMWTGGINLGGYGQFYVGKSKHSRQAHRVAYELLVGPIPEGLTLDHLCHGKDAACVGGPACLHRRCVNPAHAEPTTIGENTLRGHSITAANIRKTHCKRGHELTGSNLYIDPARPNVRQCRPCRTILAAKYREERAHGVA